MAAAYLYKKSGSTLLTKRGDGAFAEAANSDVVGTSLPPWRPENAARHHREVVKG